MLRDFCNSVEVFVKLSLGFLLMALLSFNIANAAEIVCNEGALVISDVSGQTNVKVYNAGVTKYFRSAISPRSDCGYGYCS